MEGLIGILNFLYVRVMCSKAKRQERVDVGRPAVQNS
jgi:hypothetical protein